jgi:signal transduction histidine kinase
VRNHRWHHRAHRRLRHSLKARLVLLFLLLAFTLGSAFLFGMQNALRAGWKDAARPLLADYVDRLAAEIGSPPDVARARALAERLPITVAISGPSVQWSSSDEREEGPPRRWLHADNLWGPETNLLARTTADGHRIEFGVNLRPWHGRSRGWGLATLAVLLVLTALAYKAVRRLLRPLDDIREGAQRFGQGRFDEPIPVRRKDELGDLAQDVNAMASSIHQMLEAKRALLLAISHELRSPITRARLNTELLPDAGDTGERRQALLRDLQEMSHLVTELLESERLGQGHAALHREQVDLASLLDDVITSLGETGAQHACEVQAQPGLPALSLDRARMRLLLRNLLDNALRHNAGSGRPVQVQLEHDTGHVMLRVRDFGPGVSEAALAHLAEPFYRADAARERATGGIGLGLYLCKLVAQAHGGRMQLRNAAPGLEVTVTLPL